MATSYCIIIRGSGPTDVQEAVESFVTALRDVGHDIAVAEVEKRELADCSPQAIEARTAAAAAAAAEAESAPAEPPVLVPAPEPEAEPEA